MGLSRLDNFLKSVRGTILYVDPNSLDATDSIENQGNSLTRPFKTIQRALLEASRFSYQRGLNNDRFNKTTILLYPGDHIVDNRPGWIPDSSATGGFRLRSSESSDQLPPFDLTTNFDITTDDNVLYKLNSVYGGVIVPRGTSIVGMDLRKTKIRPRYVPNPENDQIERSCIFRVTGACYFWQFTILDADPNSICYKDYTTNKFVPNFSHHKLSCFEYADGVNNVSILDDFYPSGLKYNVTDLDMYYQKVGIVYGQASGRPIEPDYPSSTIDVQTVIDEYRIVGSRGAEVGISSIRSGDGVTPTTTITVTLPEATNQFDVDTPIQIRGVNATGYDGQYVISEVLSQTEYQYRVQNAPLDPLPVPSGATMSIAIDTVTSASPYIFNLSMRSVYGMCGLLADGSKAAGFKSMVVAQFTGIGLQKDNNAFVKYDSNSGTYIDSASVVNIHSDSRARYKPNYENFHIRGINDAYLQLVSVFAIGFSEHFSVESGGDFSINNSNSNFGAKAFSASGFRNDAFIKDDLGYITHFISPKEIEISEINIDYLALDVAKIVSAASTHRLYLYNQTDENSPPNGVIDGYRIGSRRDERLYLQISQSGVTTEYSAKVIMPNTAYTDSETSSEKIFFVGRSTIGINSISANIITLTSPHSFINGESIRIISENGHLPDGLDENRLYCVITDSVAGIGTNQIQIAQNVNDAINNTPIAFNSNGGVLKITSRVSDKAPGSIGHPLQYDSGVGNWYINVDTNNTIYPTIVGLGTSGLGDATSRTYIRRNSTSRSILDSIYKVRYVIPKDSPYSARHPLDGYIIQESNNTLGEGTAEIVKYFNPSTSTLSNSCQLRNPRFIAGANWNGGTANIRTELPHNLTVGSEVEVLNIISTNNTTGTAKSAYNGTFTVTGISSTKEFSYSLTNNPGTFLNDTSARNSNLPRFNHKKLKGTYYIYRSQQIQEYIQNIQDGIYHFLVVNASNSPTVSPFNNLKFSQPVQNLYPQSNRDNPVSDPPAAKSFASPKVIGKVIINDPQNSLTKETAQNSLVDFNVGLGITDIVSSSGIAHTLYTTIDHGLCGVTSVGILTGGTGYVAGVYYNARLVGFGTTSGKNATARVTVGAGGTVTAVKIMDGGSAYGIGNTASLVGFGTTGSGAVVRIENIYDNVGDCISISGVSSASYSEYNALYRIVGVPTSKEINVISAETITGFSTTGLGQVITQNANVVLTGRILGISSLTYNNTTGVGLVTFTSAHGLVSNNKIHLSGFDNSLYNGDFIVKKVTNLTTVTLGIGKSTSAPSTIGTAFAYKPLLTSQAGDYDNLTENSSGRLIYEYAGITTTLGTTVLASALDTTPIVIPGADVLGLNIGDYLLINSEIFRIKTTVTGSSISVFRELFGTKRQTHNAGSVVRKIRVIPIELRRNSIIRASSHTFEYLGYGPGNYSTAFPEKQDRTISPQEVLLAQSTKNDGGVSIYTGMDDRGDFYTGNRKINSTTGQEEVYDTPIPTVTGEDLTGEINVGFDVLSPLEISVNRSIRVEGGSDSNLISQFDGPVVFTNKVTSTSDKGIEAKSLFLHGDSDVSRKITVGISTPTLAGNVGDQVYNAYPSSNGYAGWIYTTNNKWEKFARVTPPVYESSVGVSSGGGYLGIASLINFVTNGITLNSQYNNATGITTLTFSGTGPVPITIGVSTSNTNTFSGVSTQINFTATNIDVTASTDGTSGITTVNFVGIATTSIYVAEKYIKTGAGATTNFLKANGDDATISFLEIVNALGYVPSQSTVTNGFPQGNSIILDSLSSQFDGTKTDFTMTYVGVAYTPFGSSANLIVSIGGVIQKPGLDFNIVASGGSNTSTLRFTTAPDSGLSDFIISLGGQGYILENLVWNNKGDIVVGINNDNASVLPVGADNTVLTADSSTSTGVAWKALDISISPTWNAKGDLLVGTSNDNASILSVGANDTFLVADSSTPTGVAWKTPRITTSTSVDKLLVNRELCSVTADNITITLPASPSEGWEVGINNTSTFSNITIANNGQLLMGLSENMTLDISYATINLVFVNSSVGWRLI
jgi:hypothetical protein